MSNLKTRTGGKLKSSSYLSLILRYNQSTLFPAMCYGQHGSFSRDENLTPSQTLRSAIENAVVVEDLRGRLAETEARLERARAREAELSRRLEEMKRFVSVMEILETFLKRRFREQQQHVARLFSPLPEKN